MRMSEIDLNLLVALDNLLEARNVSNAARAIGLSQPAMSHTLSKLRTLLGDELLLRSPGKRMILTARAEALRPQLKELLIGVSLFFETQVEFVPEHCQRSFRLAANDYVQFVLLDTFLYAFRMAAPAAGVSVRPTTPRERVPALSAGELDLGIGLVPENAGPGVHQRLLFRDELVLVHSGPSQWQEGIQPGDCAERAFIVVSPQGDPGNIVDDRLKQFGVQRAKIAEVPHFAVAAYMASQSNLLSFLPRRLATLLAPRFGLTVSSASALGLPTLDIYSYWHARTVDDPACRWFRQLLALQAARIDARAEPSVHASYQ